MTPRITVVTIVISTAVTRLRLMFMTVLRACPHPPPIAHLSRCHAPYGGLRQPECRDHDVDRFDPDERDDDAANAVDEKVPPQKRRGAFGPVPDAAQRQRHQP